MMKASLTEKDDDLFYPDPLSVDYSLFKYSEPPIIYPVDETMIEKPYRVCKTLYGTSVEGLAYLDDIILLINDVPHLSKIQEKASIKFPMKKDIDAFITGNNK